MSKPTCGFIGLGLIGGSIAKALRKADAVEKIYAYDINESSLQLALEEKIIDAAAPAIDETFSSCDYIFLCAPVQKNDAQLEAIKKILPKDCILTDVGSVKTSIHEAIHAAGLDSQFIGGHPMAGSERVGFANSKANLLENAYYCLTPTPSVPVSSVEAYRALVLSMGAIPLILDFKKHDYFTAAISHLPHVIASSLVNLVRTSDSEEGTMKMIAAGGFKDITRIASSSADMWQQICLTNTDNILALLDDYMKSLEVIRKNLVERDKEAIYDFFDSARIYRDSFINASSGPIKRSFSFHVDIADKSGSLAHIVTLLAEKNINIKNIEITHNRETEDGVLRLELYDEVSFRESKKILEEADYSIHQPK